MICKKCSSGKIVMHAFSEAPCENNCGTLVQTSHTPCDKYCKPCSDKLKVCKECGDSISIFKPN